MSAFGPASPLGLQVVFPEWPRLDAAALTASLRAYHPELAGATCEVGGVGQRQGGPLGVARWGKHAVRLAGFGAPLPPEVVERCVRPAHYKPELKEQARRHKAHVLLSYASRDGDAYEQYVALAAVAGALAGHGALAVLNEAAHTSFPAAALARPAVPDAMDWLHGLLLHLYCGFVKYGVEGEPGVWMRTHGCPRLGLPDLARHAAGHHEGQRTFDIFSSVLGHALNGGAAPGVGHTMQVGEDTFLKLRAPAADEPFLDSEGTMLVAELIRADSVNRPR